LWQHFRGAGHGDGVNESSAVAIYVDGTNVYVAGDESPTGGDPVAALWISATTKVNLGTAGVGSHAIAIYNSNNVLYIAGDENGNPVYWTYNIASKAVTEYALSSDAGAAADIFVSGSDVYTTGNKGSDDAVYWKNTTVNALSSAPEKAQAAGITLNGADIYVAGASSLTGTTTDIKPVYWKNSVRTVLDTAKASEIGYAIRAVANDGDVYISGFYADSTSPTYAIAAYWKNGTRVDLTDNTGKAEAFGIFIK